MTQKREQKQGIVTELCSWRCLSLGRVTAPLPNMTQWAARQRRLLHGRTMMPNTSTNWPNDLFSAGMASEDPDCRASQISSLEGFTFHDSLQETGMRCNNQECKNTQKSVILLDFRPVQTPSQRWNVCPFSSGSVRHDPVHFLSATTLTSKIVVLNGGETVISHPHVWSSRRENPVFKRLALSSVITGAAVTDSSHRELVFYKLGNTESGSFKNGLDPFSLHTFDL